MRIPLVRPTPDIVGWLQLPDLPRSSITLADFLPPAFEGYVRICHNVGHPDMSWGAVAEQNGLAAHPQMQWHVVGSGIRSQEIYPPEGRMRPTCLENLVRCLGRVSRRDMRLWCSIWPGWGDLGFAPGFLDTDPRSDFSPRQSLEGWTWRSAGWEYVLFSRDHLDGVVDLLPRTPNLFWPETREWCVYTSVDFDSTYVGGPRPVVDALLVDEGLEVYEVAQGDAVGWGSDPTLSP